MSKSGITRRNVLATIAGAGAAGMVSGHADAATDPCHLSETAAELAASVTPTDIGYQPGDVRRYGAVGDGSTDDTAAIQAALNSNGQVWLQPGLTYMVSTLWPKSNQTFDLNHGTLKLLAGAYWQTPVIMASPYSRYRSVGLYRPGVTGMDNVIIRNGTIDGNVANQQSATAEPGTGGFGPNDGGLDGIRVQGVVNNLLAEKLIITNCFGDGFNVSHNYFGVTGKPDNITVIDVDMDGNGRQGSSITDGNNITYARCKFRNTFNERLSAATFTPYIAGGHTFSIGDECSESVTDPNYNRNYECTVGGVSSGTAPTHTSGTAKDGGVTWEYKYRARKEFSNGIHRSSAYGPWFGCDIEPSTDVENVKFTDCDFTGNAGIGLSPSMGSDTIDGVQIDNCRLVGNALQWGHDGDLSFTVKKAAAVVKNTVVSNSVIGQLVLQGNGTANVEVTGCTIGRESSSTNVFVRSIADGSTLMMSNCDIYGGGSGGFTSVIDFGLLGDVVISISGGSITQTGTDTAVASYGANKGVPSIHLNGVVITAVTEGVAIKGDTVGYISGGTIIKDCNTWGARVSDNSGAHTPILYTDDCTFDNCLVGVATTGAGTPALQVSGSRFLNCTTDTAGVTLISELRGAGVPTMVSGDGSTYQRTDGGKNTSLYIYFGAAWHSISAN